MDAAVLVLLLCAARLAWFARLGSDATRPLSMLLSALSKGLLSHGLLHMRTLTSVNTLKSVTIHGEKFMRMP